MQRPPKSQALCRRKNCGQLAHWLILVPCDEDSFTGVVACGDHAAAYFEFALRQYELGTGRPQAPALIELS